MALAAPPAFGQPGREKKEDRKEESQQGKAVGFQEAKQIPGQYIVVLKEEAAKPVIKQRGDKVDRLVQGLEAAGATEELSAERLEEQRGQLAQAVASTRDKVSAKVDQVKSRRNVKQSDVVAEFADVTVGFAAKLSSDQVSKLKADPDVEGVYPDYAVGLGPIEPGADAKEVGAAGQYLSCAVSRVEGPACSQCAGKWLWVLDTGIDLDHPDLNVLTSSTYAKSFISGQSVDDGNGHGTHVAGIAAAKSNSFGVVGVAAGARVVPVKVLSNAGGGSFSGVIAGLNHVAKYDIPGDVVNMSLGAYNVSNCENAIPALRDAIRNLGNAGTAVVMAAGNDNADAARNLPGCVNGKNVYTVGSTTCSGACSGFSNWGRPPVDYAAVGSSVYSTYKNKSYATLSGTSMASPVIAGVILGRGGSAPVYGGSVSCKGKYYTKGKLHCGCQ